MAHDSSSPRVSLTSATAGEVDADLLVVPVFGSKDDLADVPGLDPATGGAVSRARASGAMKGDPFQLFGTGAAGPAWKAARVLLIGAGNRPADGLEMARRTAAAGVLYARQERATRVAVLNRFAGDRGALVQAMAEGMVLSCFETGSYKRGDRERSDIVEATVVEPGGPEALQDQIRRGAVLGECSNMAKVLANEPGNVLPPRRLAERAADLASAVGLHVEVLDQEAIEKLGMGLLLGVASGSAEPPRLVVLRHDPPDAPAGPVLGLVGKGITFDTGGISIKPADNMDKMKDDMSGGAAVIGAMRAIALLGAPIRVVGLVPSAENMPGGKAIRPGDVLHAASGTTVEIMNTDAEGRLVLGDALWYARQLGATRLVDVATLTGACVVALGKTTTGVFGTPDKWVNLVCRTANRAGDRAWPLPVFDDYREQLRSEIADIVNSGTRHAGAITAAIFLKEFVGELPWAHLDIAGTAWCEEAKPYQAKGPTGVAVRTLAELAFTSDEW